MIEKAKSTLLFLILLFLPTQFGKHFWPDFSKIYGIRVDYLSPTVYATDILIILLFITSTIVFFLKKKSLKTVINPSPLITVCIALLLTVFIYHVLFSKSPFAAFYGIAKFFEFSFFGVYVASIPKDNLKNLLVKTSMIQLPVICFIALTQFITQSSLGGIFYFLGERSFTVGTPGIATILIDNQFLLRPYATFPHPNVLAFYLLLSLVFLIEYLQQPIEKKSKITVSIILITAIITLFLTFSRLIILLFAAYTVYIILTQVKNKRMKLAFSFSFLVSMAFYLSFFFSRFFSAELLIKELVLRTKLQDLALNIWLKSPTFGVGLKNFFIHEISYQKEFSEILLQPVHNIYLLTLAETGVLGLATFLFFLYLTAKRLIRYFEKETLSFKIPTDTILFASFLFIGLFDHFFLTIQQGQIMTAFILGLCWSKTKKIKSLRS